MDRIVIKQTKDGWWWSITWRRGWATIKRSGNCESCFLAVMEVLRVRGGTMMLRQPGPETTVLVPSGGGKIHRRDSGQVSRITRCGRWYGLSSWLSGPRRLFAESLPLCKPCWEI